MFAILSSLVSGFHKMTPCDGGLFPIYPRPHLDSGTCFDIEFETKNNTFNVFVDVNKLNAFNTNINKLSINGLNMTHVNNRHYQVPLSEIPV